MGSKTDPHGIPSYPGSSSHGHGSYSPDLSWDHSRDSTAREAESSTAQLASSPPKPSSAQSQALKQKSVSSKILHKLHLTHSSSPSKSTSASELQRGDVQKSSNSSGTQTPVGNTDDYRRFIATAELEDALLQEQQQLDRQQRKKFGLLSRSSSSAAQNSALQPARAPEFQSDDPAPLSKLDSELSRHFPGDLYGSERRGSTSKQFRPGQASTPYNDLNTDIIDEDELDHNDTLAWLGRPRMSRRMSDDSESSVDTVTHLMDEASHYDLIRRAAASQGHSPNDASIHEIAARHKELLSDFKSEVSGGASKALRKPLLELEEVELETFLQNFARHTREVKVPNLREKKARRMPQWSDFRISPHDEGDQDPIRKKRGSLLNRIDRGLQSLWVDEQQTGENEETHNFSKEPSSPNLCPVQGALTATKVRPTSQPFTDSASDAELGISKSTSKSKKNRNLKRSKDVGRASMDTQHEEDEGSLAHGSPDHDSAGRVHRGSLVEQSGYEERVDAQDEQVDGVAFCIAYILAFVERLAPEELDYSSDHGYREGIIRSHLERLYTIAPFWEQLGQQARSLYRWEEPRRTAIAAMIYFVLWYTDMIPTAFLLTVMWFIMRFKYFPPSESYLHERVRLRLARGLAANKLSEKLRRQSRLDILSIYKRWIVTWGEPTQEAMGILADFHEKAKNLILWRNPQASRRSLILIGILNLFVTFASAQLVLKTMWFGIGITFFGLLPLQSYFPTHRKALSPIWWLMFGVPTDAQFATQILRKRHLENEFQTAQELRKAYKDNKTLVRPDRREKPVPIEEILGEERRMDQDYVECGSLNNDLRPRKLGSFFCQYKGLPGRLHINTRYLYFTPLHNGSQKRAHTALTAVGGLTKTKSIRLWLWSSVGLKVVRTNGKAPLLFANVQNRDEAFNLILAVCSEGR